MALRIDYNTFNEAVQTLVEQVSTYGTKYDAIVAPCRGGLVLGTVLSHKLGLPLYPIMWSCRDKTTANSVPVAVYDLAILKKNILLVEDIVDSGQTVQEIVEHMGHITSNYTKPKIDVAAIINNISQPVHVQFYAHMIDRRVDQAWVDFWWEDKE